MAKKDKRVDYIKQITFRQINPLIQLTIKPLTIPSISDTLKSILKKLINTVPYSYLWRLTTKIFK